MNNSLIKKLASELQCLDDAGYSIDCENGILTLRTPDYNIVIREKVSSDNVVDYLCLYLVDSASERYMGSVFTFETPITTIKVMTILAIGQIVAVAEMFMEDL